MLSRPLQGTLGTLALRGQHQFGVILSPGITARTCNWSTLLGRNAYYDYDYDYDYDYNNTNNNNHNNNHNC